jgi:hypothetical protein
MSSGLTRPERHLADLSLNHCPSYTPPDIVNERHTQAPNEPEQSSLRAAELEQRDSSQVGGAADIFLHEELGIAYYSALTDFASY